MKKWLFASLLVTLAACSDDEPKANNNNNTNPCGAGETVRVGDELACVYSSALIEEGFSCPPLVPKGFLLTGGAVACVDGDIMPEALAERIETLGYTPEDPECFGATPAPSCFYVAPSENPAFDLTGAAEIKYTTRGGLGYCLDVGQVIGFTLNLEEKRIAFGIGVEGEEGSDQCVTDQNGCIEYANFILTLTDAQIQDILDLVGAVPAPECIEDPGLACDPCLIETLSVNTQSVDTTCCGDTAPGFGAAIDAVVAYVKALELEETPVFENASTFDALTYTASRGFGYCIDQDTVLNVTITRQQDGTLAAEGNYAALGDEAVDTCIEGTNDGNCWVSTPYGPVTLTAQAQTELEARLAALPAPMCMVDPGRVCDSCLIETLTLDQTVVNAECCGFTIPGFGPAFTAVVESIEAAR